MVRMTLTSQHKANMELEPYDPAYDADTDMYSVPDNICDECCDSGTYYTWNGIQLSCECWTGRAHAEGLLDIDLN